MVVLNHYHIIWSNKVYNNTAEFLNNSLIRIRHTQEYTNKLNHCHKTFTGSKSLYDCILIIPNTGKFSRPRTQRDI